MGNKLELILQRAVHLHLRSNSTAFVVCRQSPCSSRLHRQHLRVELSISAGPNGVQGWHCCSSTLCRWHLSALHRAWHEGATVTQLFDILQSYLRAQLRCLIQSYCMITLIIRCAWESAALCAINETRSKCSAEPPA